MVDFQYKDSYGVKDLEEIVRLLRAPSRPTSPSAAISWRRPMRPWRPSMRAAPST